MNRCLRLAVLAALFLATGLARGQHFAGHWRGALELGPASLSLVLHVEQTDDGLTATLDSPDQNAHGIPATATAVGNRLTVVIAALSATYEAALDGETLDGTFSQMGHALPLKMTRQGEAPVRKRPQEASVERDTDKPYTSHEVTFGRDGVTLAGTLTLPHGATAVPGVVLVGGSGPNDRDENILGHKPFLLLSDHLARMGFAVLRYDKRGVGGSTGGSPDDTTEQLADDALAALRYLQGRGEVDARRTGMLGHSEGGLIAVMNAARVPDELAFIVTMAAPAVKGRDLMIEQNRLVMRTMGLEATDEVMRAVEDIMTCVDTVADTQALRARLEQFVAGRPDADSQVAVMTSPAYRWLIRHDPTEALRAVRCPMLALNGTLDCQVACEQNLSAIGRLVPGATVMRYTGLNHLFQTCAGWKGSADYGAIDETLAPQVLDDIAAWLRRVAQ